MCFSNAVPSLDPAFTFQYGTNLITDLQDALCELFKFTFQYGTNLIDAVTASKECILIFTFQYGTNLMLIFL